MIELVSSEQELMEERIVRDQLAMRIDVLDRVRTLALLPDDLHATVDMAANYYEVGKEAIKSLIKDHREELAEDGLTTLIGNEFVEFARSFKDPANIGEIFSPKVRSLIIIPRRALLRIGMLLRDSGVAKTVRSYLLNVEELAREEEPHVIKKAIDKTSQRIPWGSIRNAIKQKSQIDVMIGLTPAMASLIAMEDTEKELRV